MISIIVFIAFATVLLLYCAGADILLKLAIESWRYDRHERRARTKSHQQAM